MPDAIIAKNGLFENYHSLVVIVECWLAIWRVLWQECLKESIVPGIPEQKNGVRKVYTISYLFPKYFI
jgi:hypothetical protein